MKKLLLLVFIVSAFGAGILLFTTRTPSTSSHSAESKSSQPDGAPSQLAPSTANSPNTPGKQETSRAADKATLASNKDAGAAKSEDASSKQKGDPFNYGRTPRVKGDANPSVVAVVEARRTNSNPERLSVMLTPKSFDEAAFKANPEEYLRIAEPGRALQPKQPADGVPILKIASSQFVRIKQNESTLLRVQTTPKGVANFTSFDLGKFQNELTAISVQADDQGIAEVKFSGAPGTIEDVHIVCASPQTSGTVRFTVNVAKP